MTIICGYARGGEVWFGADSRLTHSRLIYPARQRKITRFGAWWIGIAGDSVSQQLLERKANELADQSSPFAIALIIHALFKEAGYRQCPDHSGPPCYEQEALVASRNGVWEISSNGAVLAPSWGFAAIGSGQLHAYGAAHALHALGHEPRALVAAALAAAAAFDIGCGGEVDIIRVE